VLVFGGAKRHRLVSRQAHARISINKNLTKQGLVSSIKTLINSEKSKTKQKKYDIIYQNMEGIMLNNKISMTANELYNKLLTANIINKPGNIVFSLAGTSVIINTTDIVGNSIQSWLKQWMDNNNIYNNEPENTQEFPDFYLSQETKTGLLEVKAFNYNASPAFDIANFESYCDSVSVKPYRLVADYIIFGYTMEKNGEINIKNVWLKKIWEIAGKSKRFALNTQVKRNVIYNIRPKSNFRNEKASEFRNEQDFLKAIYDTLAVYRGQENADIWKTRLSENYFSYYNKKLTF
jgi:hypothetical protein